MDSIVADFRSEAYDSALAKLIDIEKEKPYDPEILNLLGSVYMKKKDFVSATKYFDLSLNKKPGFFPAAFNYGELLFIQKNTRKPADTIRCWRCRLPAMSFCNSKLLFVTSSSVTNPRPNSPLKISPIRETRLLGITPKRLGNTGMASRKSSRLHFHSQIDLRCQHPAFDETFANLGLKL